MSSLSFNGTKIDILYKICYTDFKKYQETKMVPKEKLLLLSCCAPCSVGVIEDLKRQDVDFTVLFFNPNIQPVEEYQKRLEENRRICALYHVPFIDLEYTPQKWKEFVKGLENEPEKGKRCDKCFYFRLKRTAQYAKENGYTRISSVLGISRFKDFNQVCRAGLKVQEEENIPYDTENWRKKGRLERSEHLSKELSLYRQTYCGCKPK